MSYCFIVYNTELKTLPFNTPTRDGWRWFISEKHIELISGDYEDTRAYTVIKASISNLVKAIADPLYYGSATKNNILIMPNYVDWAISTGCKDNTVTIVAGDMVEDIKVNALLHP